MKIKDIMARDVKSILPEMNAREAIERLFDMKISGLPVIDQHGKLVGMFTEKDILRNIFPSYLSQVGKFVYVEDPKWIKNKAAELSRLKVADLMRKEVVTVDQEASLTEVARIMLTQKARRMPVLDKDGKVAGIVAREDVVKKLIASEAKR